MMGGILYYGTEADPEDFMWKLDIGRAKAIAAGNMRSYAVLKDGTVWSWKNIVQKKKYAAAQLPGFAKMTTIAAGSRNTDFAVGLDEKGNPWAWGDNSARTPDRQSVSEGRLHRCGQQQCVRHLERAAVGLRNE
ncbi:hypothetical protein NDS46_25880 [Paenibacillus thiaminolyticus]|uniref:hypothetical protein n=1 Tax=Paenibacillus thiaminolyticus TaxID=49283 RepID=UPI00232B97A7|nr:hypothetical protein [Paenibacillus thiaminolyticus]WCF07693.1 hypothetical protein NDS46_25880 [Paenibacillus thiaminolyticus]